MQSSAKEFNLAFELKYVLNFYYKFFLLFNIKFEKNKFINYL